jgi:ankyrin repeat protein
MSSEVEYEYQDNAIDALIAAARRGDVATANALLDANPALVGRLSMDGSSALTNAVYAGQPEMIALLRARGATLTLFDAAALGDLAALNAALASGQTSVHAYSFDGWTALHLTASFGQIEAARALLAAGANVAAHSWNGLDGEPLHAAAARKGNTAMVAVLLDAGAQVNARQSHGLTALHLAAHNGDDDLVTLLLARGARRHLVTDEEKTPADLAIQVGRLDLAARLE